MSVGAVRKKGTQPRLQLWLIVFVGLLLLLMVGWTIFWHFAARQSAVSLDAWIAREKTFNRIWTCPDRQIGGYPFAIDITCRKPEFDGLIFGRHYTGSLSGFVATAEFVNPTAVTVQLGSPFIAVSDDKTTDLMLRFDQLAVRLGGLPQTVTTVSIIGRTLDLQGHTQGVGVLGASANHVAATFARDTVRQDRAIGFHVVLMGATFPVVDQFLGEAAPADVTADGDVTQISFDPAQTPVASLDRWRAAGGRVDLTNLAVTRDPTKVQAHGVLSIDAAHEIQGRLDMRCIGFEPVLRRLGVNPALIAAGSLLANLLGGDNADASKSNEPQPLHVLVGFNDGRLSVGPVHTSIKLPPLY